MRANCKLNVATFSLISVLCAVVGAPAGENAQPPKEAGKANEEAKQENDLPVNDKKFHERLLAIAAEYRKYGRVDADLRAALLDCRAPSRHEGLPRISNSGDESTHGRKVYYLYAKDASAYGKIKSDAKQIGQVIVKEAWGAEQVETDSDVTIREVTRDGKTYKALQFTVRHGDQRFTTGELNSLFVMYKADQADPQTDNGWVYGTVTADGRQVTSAGRVQSCMNCHKDAPHGRLFGLKPIENP